MGSNVLMRGSRVGLKAGSLVSAAVLGSDMLVRRGSGEDEDEDGAADGPAYIPLARD